MHKFIAAVERGLGVVAERPDLLWPWFGEPAGKVAGTDDLLAHWLVREAPLTGALECVPQRRDLLLEYRAHAHDPADGAEELVLVSAQNADWEAVLVDTVAFVHEQHYRRDVPLSVARTQLVRPVLALVGTPIITRQPERAISGDEDVRPAPLRSLLPL